MKLLSIEQAKTNVMNIVSLIDEGLPIHRLKDIMEDSLGGSTESFSLLYHALLYIREMKPSERKNICSDISVFCCKVFGSRIHHSSTYSYNILARGIVTTIIKNTFVEIAKKWPKYSGSEGYPVPYAFPAKPGYLSPYAAFWETHSGCFWVGEYGVLRKELLDFCIEELSK